MSVDLSDYIDSLQREVYPPGANDFPNATADEWTGRLADAFWEARLDGLLSGFTCDADGIITPIVPTGMNPSTVPDMGRDWIQLVVLYASFAAIRNTLRDLKTNFIAQAGSVRYEAAQSANLLVEIMKDIVTRRDVILMRLSDLGATNVTVIDAIVARDQSIMQQWTWFVSSGDIIPDAYRLYSVEH